MPVTPKTIVKGDDLMLFDASSNSLGYATSHSLTINADAVDVSSKDHGIWSGSTVNKISWEISSENLYTKEEYDRLFSMITGRTAVTVFFGQKAATTNVVADGDASCYTKDASACYTGKAYITSLVANANSGENATFSIQLKGTGKIQKV